MLQITMKTLAKVLSKDKTQRSRGHGNEISVEELLQIPEKLMRPAVILKNRNADHEIIPNNIIAVLDLENENGTVIVPIELKRTNGKYKIKSIFPKKSKSWIDDRIAEGDLLFIDKTKTTSEMKQTRHQSPTRSSTDGFVGNNISSTGKNVNEYNQMAGENAKTAALDKLDQAKQMDGEGKSKEEVYKATGWLKGADGKWRFEIPDNLKNIASRKKCTGIGFAARFKLLGLLYVLSQSLRMV